MIVRVQTPSGTKRYTVNPEDSLESLKLQVSKDTGIEPKNMPFLEKLVPSTDTKPIVGDKASLADLGIKHGALLILDSSAHTVPDYKDKEDTEKQSKVSISERGEIVTEEVKTVVEEDALDVDLYKVDGWIRLREDAKETKLDDFVAPWNIEQYEPWKSMNLGHIPFHSWARKNQDLYWQPLRIPNTNSKSSTYSQFARVEQIKRQPYRHVDSVVFQHFEIANNFIQAWVRTGIQQYGILYGKYVKEEKIPLGISAVVSAIYTPSTWNPFPVEEVKELAGYGPNLVLILKREILNRVNEFYHMARYQAEHPNVWKKSNTSKWGSKFVSVVALDNEQGQPHLRGFQLSNQGAQLINENVIKVGRKKFNKFIVSRSNERWIYPEIEYFETTGGEGERNTTLKKAGRYLDDDVLPYFVVTCPATYPVNPNPLFTTFSFPATFSKNHKHGTLEDAIRQLETGLKSNNLRDSLNDFHFLLWCYKFMLEEGAGELAHKLIQYVQREAKLEVEVKEGLQTLFGSITKTSPASRSSSTTTTSTTDPKIGQIMEMGYPEHMAREALEVSGGSLEAAINYLLSDIH